MKRFKMSKRSSNKSFRRGTHTKNRNVPQTMPMRGGFRA